jgi:hypothetical protein
MGFIYKIICNITGECYFGKSNQSKKWRRFNDHTCKSNECSSRQIIDRGNYNFVVLEDNIEEGELLEREHYYITNFECVNIHIPYLTTDDRRVRTLKAQNKKYNKNEEFRLKKIEYQSDYYDKKKDVINHNRRQKIVCECGVVMSNNNISRHRNSGVHKKYLDSIC